MAMAEQHNYIVTACDAGYFKSFQQLLYTYKQTGEDQNSAVIFYDLGLDQHQVDFFHKDLLPAYPRLSYRRFDYSKYPDFVHPSFNTYSWKPIIIHEVFNETKGNVFWLDSANLILKNLAPIWKEIETAGTYVPISGSGTLAEWTLQATFDYLTVPEAFYKARNRAGNTCAFAYNHPEVRALVDRWNDLAYIRECIRPAGASRANHRDDQSLLTILLLEQEAKGTLQLSEDEVDISSGHPTSFISVRNKLALNSQLPVGGMALMYFKAFRLLDIFVNKIKGN